MSTDTNKYDLKSCHFGFMVGILPIKIYESEDYN